MWQKYNKNTIDLWHNFEIQCVVRVLYCTFIILIEIAKYVELTEQRFNNKIRISRVIYINNVAKIARHKINN